MHKGVQINPQKRQLLFYAAVCVLWLMVEAEKYAVKKLDSSCIQICTPFICKPNIFSLTYKEMA